MDFNLASLINLIEFNEGGLDEIILRQRPLVYQYVQNLDKQRITM